MLNFPQITHTCALKLFLRRCKRRRSNSDNLTRSFQISVAFLLFRRRFSRRLRRKGADSLAVSRRPEYQSESAWVFPTKSYAPYKFYADANKNLRLVCINAPSRRFLRQLWLTESAHRSAGKTNPRQNPKPSNQKSALFLR